MKFIFFNLVLLLTNFDHRSKAMQDQKLTYLALGDSYTIGEAVAEGERWPMQLVSKLNQEGIGITSPRIIAKTGWTTDELLEAVANESVQEYYDVVSLLIGVNNQYRGYAIEQYEKEFEELLDLAIVYARGNTNSVFVVSIPDYGVTPFVKEKGGDAIRIASDLDKYNDIAKRICLAKGVSFTSITEGSKKADGDKTLVASDGLHPSGKMYAEWTDLVFKSVFDELSSR